MSNWKSVVVCQAQADLLGQVAEEIQVQVTAQNP